ncbi:MAG: hypothetical protein ACRCSX_10440 [Allorhizobium sp.]
MPDQPENPPVFPNVLTMGGKAMSLDGLCLRDLFAAAALTGFCSLPEDEVMGAADTAKAAYNFADAMLRERGK